MVSMRSLHRSATILLLAASQSLLTTNVARSEIVVSGVVATNYGNLGISAGGTITITGINSSGDIAGYYGSPGATTAFVFDNPEVGPGVRIDIPGDDPSEGSASSKAHGIAERTNGIGSAGVVGERSGTPYPTGFILGSRTGSASNVPNLSSITGAARGINNAGIVVGGYGSTAPVQAFSSSAPFDSLQTTILFDGTSVANGVNDNGVIVGSAISGTGDQVTQQAYVFAGATTGVLFTDPSYASSVANGVSNSADPTIVGSVEIGGVNNAFAYQNGAYSFLSFGDRAVLNSEAFAVNKDGWIVGTAQSVDETYVGFLAIDGKMFDLNTFLSKNLYDEGFRITSARAISDNGLIGAMAFHGDTFQALSLQITAVPEPGSVLLLSMIGVGGWFKYRRRQSKIASA